LLVFLEILRVALMPMGIGGNMGHKTLPRISKLKTGLLILFLSTLVFATAAVGKRMWRFTIFFRDKEKGVVLVESLRDRQPSNIPDEAWEFAVNWTRTAYVNVFASVDTLGSGDIRSFNQDAARIIEENEGFEAIQELWERFAQSGPSGELYVAKYYPDVLRGYSYHMDKQSDVHSSPNDDSSPDKPNEQNPRDSDGS
jgi:hypothetical protein